MRGERQEGLPSHPPKRTNGADRHSAHSGTTQHGAQQPAAAENLRETIARSHRRHADRLREPDSTTLWYLQIGPEVERIR